MLVIVSIHNLVIADHYAPIRQHLRTLLACEPHLHVAGEVADGLALLEYMEHTRELPELVVSGVTMPGVSGIDVARRIKHAHPGIKIIIVTVYDEREYLEEALSAGADGYVLKDRMDVELIPAIFEVLEGRRYVSDLKD